MQGTRLPVVAPISPRELPIWVPGTVMSRSDDLGWHEVAFRRYDYQGQDVEIPSMDSYMIVQYDVGETPMDRKVEDGRWTRTRCRPGNFSLLSRTANSHWHWTMPVEVNHIYLTKTILNRTASEMRGEEVTEVLLHDIVDGNDPAISSIISQITQEATDRRMGGALYVEALSVQLAVQLLRNFSTCVYKGPPPLTKRFSERAIAEVEDFIEAHLGDNILIEDMARIVGMGVWTFNRHLRQSVGKSAYALVVEKRIERAQSLLRHGNLPLKEIAVSCGFSDQAHMTRMFQAKLGVTPGQFRSKL